MCFWEFPVGSVVRTQCFHCWGPRFNPWSGSEILQATQRGQKKKVFLGGSRPFCPHSPEDILPLRAWDSLKDPVKCKYIS